MDKPKQQNPQTNRLYANKPKIQKQRKKTQAIDGWQANMQQEKQRKTIYMQICLKLAKTTEKRPNKKQEQNSI